MWHTFFSCHGAAAPNGPEILHYRSFMIALRHTTLGRTPLDEGSARRRRLYLTTHNTHKKNIVVRGGIRTRNSSKRVAADSFIRPRGHWIGCRVHTVTKCILALVVKPCGLVDGYQRLRATYFVHLQDSSGRTVFL